METREIRCAHCEVLNRVPRYSIKRIPLCGNCRHPLPESSITRFLRDLDRFRRPAAIAVAIAGAASFYLWLLQEPVPPHDLVDVAPALIRQPAKPPEAVSPLPAQTQPQTAPAAPVDVCATRLPPRQGVYRVYGAPADLIARLTIRVATGANYFVKLENAPTGTPVMSFFIYGGSTMDADVPLGKFVLKYAAGKSWCGDADLFGPDTATSKAEHIFTFERRFVTGGYDVTHEIVELILQPGGNLRTTRIRREDF